MTKVLLLLRAVPGAGKSTFAKFIKDLDPDNTVICEADNYHIIDGIYKWKPERVKYSHEMCQRDCREAMEANVSKVVVSNTSTTSREIAPYIEMANQYGYRITSLIVENRHGNTSVHNVPEQTLEQMENRFEIKLR